MQLAPSIADEIQDELILWFLANQNFIIKHAIYNLLDEASRGLIAELEAKHAVMPLNTPEKIQFLNQIENKALQKVILKEAKNTI